MFVGRENELESLNKLYKDNEFQFVVVYGRRRVGKTTLLLEFCKEKPCIFFVADESVDSIALEKFSKEVFSYFHLNGLRGFQSWEEAFYFLGERSKKERLVVVIDEFQYLVNSNKSIPSILQKLIDHHLKNTKLFLIVCGSYVSFMEKEVLGHESPLYGRRTAQFEIAPFDFFDSRSFFPEYNLEEQVITYGILGGTPQYLVSFNGKLDVFENVKQRILSKSSYLYEEPRFLLREELREPMVYNSILEAIATGRTKLNEIATKIRVDNAKVSKYITVLINLKIVEKVKPEPIGKTGRSSVFKIKDNFFRFWYRFIFKNRELIEQRLIDNVLEKKIKPFINDYLGLVFENIAFEYLKRINGKEKLPFVFEKIGKWWGNNPIKKQEEEIDIVAYDKESIIFGECKWKDGIVDMSVIEKLIAKSALFDFKNKFYVYFSKNGFTDEVVNFAKASKNILLFSLNDLIDFS
ncbi:AAA family ATPase [Thermosipho ferrireducens]|uniref:AAA family ATPase n=1 Tax=Thermosipho ferrireducens TaxID=2571116 RepID=A0ABX7S9G7_9BACT|nr:ATP-binding protein [Thermosipho ferrireducens]QTA38525.1 AAA family ATPase [Thermosipho ferrireducens]